ncbi:MAG: alpha/beta hydrolase [Proteobacteria bacterium]|nr:alpha/beta hydrolase [Pseudomonadota bacterium]
MAYADDGVGPPILLVHGWAAHGGFFSDLHTHLARTHRVLTPTLRGHPGSDIGAAPLTIEALADDIAQFVEGLGLTSLVAIGWSMGAMVLWQAATKLGSRLRGIVVEEMGPRLVNDATWRNGISGGYGADDIDATLREIRAGWPAYVARFAPRMFAPGAGADLIAWTAAEMSRAEPEAMAAFWASMVKQDFRAPLARLTTPMLVIAGAQSQVYGDGATAFVAHAAPHAERVIISGAGHVPHLEAQDAFIEHVEAFARAARQPDSIGKGVSP